MKVKINIDVWDDGQSASQLEEYGMTSKFVQKMYEEAFKVILSSAGFDENGLSYSCNVEVVEDESNPSS